LTGRHLTDCQRRLYMKLRETHAPAIAGAKAGFSTATAYLLEKELRLRPPGKPPRERRRPDPLIDIWDSEIVPMLIAAPGLRSVAIIEEMNVSDRFPHGGEALTGGTVYAAALV
jgi:hypothetical protein